MMAADPHLAKLFQSYNVVQGLEMFGACLQRAVEGSTVFLPKSRL